MCIAAGATTSCNRGPDISTPKKAATAFAKAVQDGDMDTLRKTSAGTDDDFKGLQAVSDMSQARKRFEAASIKKFGDAGKVNDPGLGVQVATDLENGDEKIDGGKATVTSKSTGNGSTPLSLKKDSDGWKVDLSAMFNNPSVPIPLGPMMSKMSKPIVDAVDATTKDVEDGKFKTADEAQTSLQAGMGKAILSGMK